MNQTLDEIARTLFTSWFVTFDPVRAKAEGRQPEGMDAETAALFPDRFVDSALGPIPEGWGVGALDAWVSVTKGRSYRSHELAESDCALVTLKSFNRGGGYREDGLKAFTGIFKPDQQVKPGELIVALTDVTQAADIVGQPAIVLPDARFERLVASLDVAIVRPKSQTGVPFLYGLMRSEQFNNHARSHTTGTTVLHLSSSALKTFRLATPDVPLVRAYEDIAQTLLNLISMNADESRVLVDLRDTLLPELLSGEVCGPVAEQLVGAV